MSDEKTATAAAAQPSSDVAPAAEVEKAASDSVVAPNDAKPIDKEGAAADDADKGDKEDGDSAAKPAEGEAEETTAASTEEAPAAASEENPTDPDVEMADKPADETNESTTNTKVESEKATEANETAPTAAESATDAAAVERGPETPADKSKARRKSAGGTNKKTLNKKASKAKILHVDAKPGEHYFAKLKGFPPWPVIIAEEDMLPQSMLSTRPVTAARPDGTYREDFADGGKRIADRTFPVMYLHTNEFSWTTNTDLSELDHTTVASLITTKMRKDLQNAHLLASEQNSLDYYKNVLREFEEQRLAKLEAKKSKAKTPKKASKVAEAPAADEDEDMEMPDIDEGDDAEPVEKKPKSKKRKHDDDNGAPQRAESVKKPKIKLTTSSTPKASNGVQSPTTKDSSKPVKVNSKPTKGGKDKAEKKEKEPPAPKEPELSPEEKLARKEEVLFLRHRLQKGILGREKDPQPDDMPSMSDFLAKLETLPDLEPVIIRKTKINKVLKAILKLDDIPRQEEFQFKPRSQALLDKWNKLLASEGTAPSAGANGVNGSASTANGVKEASTDDKADPEKEDAKEEDDADQAETKDSENADEAKVRLR
ncbi:hypothetical protein M426DRAFT_163120 [Hypoxylon sp. CI-4A]|nr:hypothetical protein M426DRAFT_163120 [Hypoxylon sp. CI-4A]